MNKSPVVKALVMGLALAACSEASNPVAPEAQAGLVSGLLSNTLSLVERLVPLANETVVTRTVGAEGGILSGGGVTLSIPAGALSEPVAITMTVPAGQFFEAEFAPHGLKFARRATLTFGLDGLSGLLDLKLGGAYFVGDLDGDYDTLETFSGKTGEGSFSYDIKHFSGYCVVSGRSSR